MTKSVSGSGLCYSSASTSGDGQFNPTITWLPAMDLEELQAVSKMEMNTGDCIAYPAFQCCNNPDGTIQAAEQIDSSEYFSTDGVHRMTTWYDLTSGSYTASVDAYQYVRFGFMVKNSSYNTRHFFRGEIRVDYRMKDS